MMKKKFVTTGLLAGLVAGTGAGLVLQQTGLAGAAAAPAVAVVEDDIGTDDTGTTGADADRPDPGTRLTEVLQPLVDDGTLTADQLTAVVDALVDARPGDGGRGPGGPGGHGGHGHGRGGPGLDAAATALGITTDELRTALSDGTTTIAAVAAERGVDVQTVIDAMVAEVSAHLADEVAEGDLTQDEADARLAEVTTRITEMVNTARPARPDVTGSSTDPGDTAETSASISL